MEIQIDAKSTRKREEDIGTYVNAGKRDQVLTNQEKQSRFAVVNVKQRQW